MAIAFWIPSDAGQGPARRRLSDGGLRGRVPPGWRFGLDQGFQTYDGRFGEEGGGHNRRTAEEVTRRGLAWLETCEKEAAKKPFFLFLHYYNAHRTYHPPAPFDKTFADDLYAGGIAYVDSWIGRVMGRSARTETVRQHAADHRG